MNTNTLGIVAVSVVALGGIATIALQKRASVPEPRTSPHFIAAVNDDAEYGIILQGDLNADQWAAIQQILNSNSSYRAADRKKLYRIRQFKDGAPLPNDQDENHDDGELPVGQLLQDRKMVFDYLTSPKVKFTGYAFQIGIGGKDSYRESPISAPSMPQAHGKINMRESKEMIEEVNKIQPPLP